MKKDEELEKDLATLREWGRYLEMLELARAVWDLRRQAPGVFLPAFRLPERVNVTENK
jgi:hypothetical protein